MDRIKVLHAHNYYLQPGGEDTAFTTEVALLRDHGQDVTEYVEYNRQTKYLGRIPMALQTMWSWPTYRRLRETLHREQPDLVHFHNTFPLISPSAYDACRSLSIPVIQSLDNPRLLCPSANFYRNGRLCQDCLGKTPPIPGVFHHCYHNSFLQTAVVASMLTIHRWLRTWQTKVDFYLVATKFYRRKFIDGGLPSKKIVVKPHFLFPDPEFRPADQHGDYALYIGRLDPEKGIRTMLEAWKRLPGIPVKIRGEGRLESEVQQWIEENKGSGMELIERRSKEELTKLIRNARFLVWPSQGFYETFGYVAVECFACGVPVLASRIGVQEEIVLENITGLLFNPGDPGDLSAKIRWAWDHPVEMDEMGKNARREYEARYTAEENYPKLMEIYRQAIENNRRRMGKTE
jgi:glycosyltransferase involved in cell wall biosynthesis